MRTGLLIALLTVLTLQAQAHYVPSMEKGVVELSDYCDFQRQYLVLYADAKDAGLSLEEVLKRADKLDLDEAYRALYKTDTSTKKKLEDFLTTRRRECIAKSAKSMNRVLARNGVTNLEPSGFIQESADLVKKFIALCQLNKVFGRVAYKFKAKGMPKADALEHNKSLGASWAYMVEMAYFLDSEKVEPENALDWNEQECHDGALKLMIEGAKDFPALPHLELEGD